MACWLQFSKLKPDHLSCVCTLLGLSRRPEASPLKHCDRSFLALLGSAKGFPFPVSIPTLMVSQEGFPPELVELELVLASLGGNINILQGSE